MAEKPVTKKLSELGPEDGFVAKRDMTPTQPTHMNLARDPAHMEFEIREPEPGEIVEAEIVEPDETPAVGQHLPTDEGRLTLLEEHERADGLDEIIELAESDDGVWLLLPISDFTVRIARSLPQRRYQQMIKMFREYRKFAGDGGIQIEQLDDEQLDDLLTMSEKVLQLCVCPDDWPMIEEGLDSLTNPIGPTELGPVVSQVVPRYTKGIGATKGK